MNLTPNFKLEEFACHDGTPVPDNYIPYVQELANNLQILRDHLKIPIKVVSGYRTPDYNKKVGGAKYSQHLQAKAADIQLLRPGYTQWQNAEFVRGAIEYLIANGQMKQGGIGRYNTFTHYDIRGKADRWDYSKPPYND